MFPIEERFTDLLVWLLAYLFVFYASSDVISRHWGWTRRKQAEWSQRKYGRWILMHPRLFYDGLLWFLPFVLAAIGGFYLQVNTSGTLKTAAMITAVTQAGFFGTWTIPGFLWDLPGWAVVGLWISFIWSVAVAVLYGFACPPALYFYLAYVLATGYVTLGNTGAWIVAGPPFRALGLRFRYATVGLNPVDYSVRDKREGVLLL